MLATLCSFVALLLPMSPTAAPPLLSRRGAVQAAGATVAAAAFGGLHAASAAEPTFSKVRA